MRVILDTNVLVAALRSRAGASFQIVSMLPSSKFQISLSLPLYMEYRDVLLRPDVRPPNLADSEIVDFIENILSNSETRDIHYLWRPTLKDQKDEMVLEVAVASQADYVITFNVRDFGSLELFGIEAIEPAKFLQLVSKL